MEEFSNNPYIVGVAFGEFVKEQTEKENELAEDKKQRDNRGVRWITLNGAKVRIDKNDRLLGKVGRKITGEDKNDAKFNKMFPAPKYARFGEKAHEVTKIELGTAAYIAAQKYSTDKTAGRAARMNTALRNNKPIPSDCEDTYRNLSILFRDIKGAKEPFRAYRGLPADIANALIKSTEGEMIDDGFCSFSSKISVSQSFSADAIFVCDFPKGTKAVSIRDISANPQEHEILINKGCKFRLKSYNEMNDTIYVHVEAYHEKR